MKKVSLPRIDLIGDERRGLYLIRWSMFKIFGWTLRFHVFLRDDPDCLHDHPWPFWTLVLAGSYTEEVEVAGIRVHRLRLPLSLGYRKATHRHRVLLGPGELPCLTIVITGPREREWGFWLKDKWIQWREYLDNPIRCE